MKPGFFQGKKFPFTPKRRKKSLGSQCNNIIDTRHDLAAFPSKLANVSWLRSYKVVCSWNPDLVVKLHDHQPIALALETPLCCSVPLSNYRRQACMVMPHPVHAFFK